MELILCMPVNTVICYRYSEVPWGNTVTDEFRWRFVDRQDRTHQTPKPRDRQIDESLTAMVHKIQDQIAVPRVRERPVHCRTVH